MENNSNARLFAILAHGRQKYGERPYIYHLDMVAAVLRHYYASPSLVDCGYLHDTLEDTHATRAEITGFSEEIADIVEICTGRGNNRRERQQDIKEKLRAAPLAIREQAATVKLADRIANVHSALLDNNIGRFFMYKREHEETLELYTDLAPEHILDDYEEMVRRREPLAWLI